MNYKHIVFDLDGTVIDNEQAIILSLQETIQALCSYVPNAEELTFCLGIPAADTIQTFPISDIPAAVQLWIKNLNAHADMVTIFPEIAQTLNQLQSSGYKLGIVTSKLRQEFESDFPRFGLSGYFETVVCADDTLEHKPLPAPMYKYMEISKTASHELLYIGDSIYDMKCALGAAVDFALAGWGAKTQIDAATILTSPADLLDFVSRQI